MTTISARLIKARKMRDLSQAQLALLAGLTTAAVSNIETGIRQGKGSLHALSKALGVNLEWLMNGEGEMLAADHEVKIERPSEEVPLSVSAVELAKLFDLIPISDRIKRAKAFHAASAAILDTLEN